MLDHDLTVRVCCCLSLLDPSLANPALQCCHRGWIGGRNRLDGARYLLAHLHVRLGAPSIARLAAVSMLHRVLLPPRRCTVISRLHGCCVPHYAPTLQCIISHRSPVQPRTTVVPQSSPELLSASAGALPCLHRCLTKQHHATQQACEGGRR